MSIDLTVQTPIGATAQSVQDQNGNQSALAISNTNVGIGSGPVNPHLPLTVSGNPGTAPLMEVASRSNEASIRYINNDNLGWHVGSGAGAKNFFFWNPERGIVLSLTFDGTLVTGTVHAKNLQVTELPETAQLHGLEPLLIDPATGQIFRAPARP
jgi:hypothetical protein